MIFPFLQKKIREKKNYRIVAVEPSACPSLTKANFATTLAIPPSKPLC